MKKIEAIIVADSVNLFGDRITTYRLTYPRFIHAELMTHRMFSRNSASSRAIPFAKMIEMVEDDPFIPIAWQKDHKGMQGSEYFTDEKEIQYNIETWLQAARQAILMAKILNKSQGVTKQLCNRLLEPFMWHTVLVTATEYANFFDLRCPKYVVSWYPENRPEMLEPRESTFRSKTSVKEVANIETSDWTLIDWLKTSESGAEIHIQALAEVMLDAMKESKPKQLKEGQWHIPYGDNMDDNKVFDYISNLAPIYNRFEEKPKVQEAKLKISVARAARLSYMTMDGKIDYAKDIELFDRLLKSRHLSPFEHCARTMTVEEHNNFLKGQVDSCDSTADKQEDGRWEDVFIQDNITGWCNNFKGFIPYRYFLED